MKKLMELEGAVVGDYNPFANVIDTDSPSLNFAFGKGWGLPRGYSVALWGKPKSGKTLISRMMAAKIHRDDPTAYVVNYNTEFRERLQNGPEQRAKWGIDNSRYISYEVNDPALIFDAIEKDLYAMVQEGMNLQLVVIDSIQGVRGRRSLNADSIDVQQRGDHALTIQEGLARILPIQRKANFALILICQARAEQDQAEIMRHKTVKMGATFGVQHHCEYFMFVEENKTKDGRTDMMGNVLVNDNMKDVNDKVEQTGHKIRVQMQGSSAGVGVGRFGEFTIDYQRGVINVHEEVFKLGVARGIFQRPNNTTYIYGDKKWVGKGALLEALRTNPDLQKEIVKELKKRDLEGTLIPVEQDSVISFEEV